jgi:chitin disaccharide deacetylase
MAKRKIIINADDYGLSKKFNKGILELIKKGLVTSTTVMVKKEFVEPKDLLRYKNISIGLHLELLLETPEKDIKNQIEKFRKLFGMLPSHLDGHRYYHLLPGNFSKVLKIAKKYKLPVRSASSVDRKTMKDYEIKTPNQFISWHPDRKNKLFKDLRNIMAGTTELLCHPGYFDPKAKTSYNLQREAELKILKSKQFENLIRSFDLITYEQI